jgi:hypothetical protein
MANLKNFITKDGANSGATVSIPSPVDGTDTGFTIRILGKDSDVYRKVEASQRERAVRSANITGSFKVTPEQIEQNSLDLLVACTVGWEGLEDESGNKIPFTPEAAYDLYQQSPYVREIVDKSITDRSLFAGR